MQRKHKILLVIDGVINFALGIILLFYPLGTAEWLGLPYSDTGFYPMLLGGVIFGIGIALFIERYGSPIHIRGLGLGGAIAINFCGAIVLLIWLISTPPDIPLRGHIILWSVAIIVMLIGMVEVISRSWQNKK